MPQNLFDKKPIFVVDAVRTAIGSPFKSLKDFSVGQLGGLLVKALMERSQLNIDCVDEVILGSAVLAGAGQNPARQASLAGGLSPRTTAYTVNNVCGAGLQAVILAGQAMSCAATECSIAIGSESASRTPQMFSKLLETPFNEREPVDSLIYDGLWCLLSNSFMGEICENLVRRERISRVDQDQYALESHQKAAVAQFGQYIIPVVLHNQTIFCNDERIRHRVSLENFAALSSAFVKDGTVTAGNASVPADGAAAVLLATKSCIDAQSLQPLIRILGYASIAMDPQQVFFAGVPAVEACLQTCGLQLKDIDIFEVSEAFAAQALYTRKTLNIPSSKMNICGGDIALGHPLGASGTRILVTLIHTLKSQNKKYGLAVICYGGGGAIAVIVENERTC